MIKCGYKSINGDYIFTKTAKMVEEYKINNPNKQVLNLGVGDVNLPPPDIVCDFLKSETERFCTKSGFCGYPDERGIIELRQAISDYYKGLGSRVFADEIFVTTGAKPALGELFELCDFKRVAIVTPTYPLYEELCCLHSVEFERVSATKENEFPLPTQKCDAIFLCSPNNPTGAVLTYNHLERYINYAKENNSLIIIDGAYADFTERYNCPYLLENSECIIEVRSYSKNLCFTGLRCGFIVIKNKNPLHKGYEKYLRLRSNGVNAIVQRTAVCAYTKECVLQQKERMQIYRENASLLRELFTGFGYECTLGLDVPFVVVKVNQNGEDFCKNLLFKCGVVATPGEAFCADKSIRFSCLVYNAVALEGVKRMCKFLQNKSNHL